MLHPARIDVVIAFWRFSTLVYFFASDEEHRRESQNQYFEIGNIVNFKFIYV